MRRQIATLCRVRDACDLRRRQMACDATFQFHITNDEETRHTYFVQTVSLSDWITAEGVLLIILGNNELSQGRRCDVHLPQLSDIRARGEGTRSPVYLVYTARCQGLDPLAILSWLNSLLVCCAAPQSPVDLGRASQSGRGQQERESRETTLAHLDPSTQVATHTIRSVRSTGTQSTYRACILRTKTWARQRHTHGTNPGR